MMSVILEDVLDEEMDEELGYSKYDYRNKVTDNSHNGHSDCLRGWDFRFPSGNQGPLLMGHADIDSREKEEEEHEYKDTERRRRSPCRYLMIGRIPGLRSVSIPEKGMIHIEV